MLPTSHPDHLILAEIEQELVNAIGSREKLISELPTKLRLALDEVIDTERTGRVWISDLEKTEKTYIGTKVEIVVRAYFAFPKGRLDLRIANHDVDVKNTIGKTWMIPQEAVDCACLLLAEDDVKAICSAGLIIAKEENLTGGVNRDGKRSVSSTGRGNIWWLFRDAPMTGFWNTIDPSLISEIMDPSAGGTERIGRLFTIIQNRPIHRSTVRSVARQKDYMKRLRKNGGARDPLAEIGIAILSGKSCSELIKNFGLPPCGKDEFISFTPQTTEQRSILKDQGWL